jgi:HNH endonuclease
MEDDYGDKTISTDFYKGQEVSEDQKKMAARTRKVVEKEVGRYSDLRKLVESQESDLASNRAKTLFKRKLILQWVKGSPDVAESSFYKINSLGAPLDDTERMLIENRRKPIAIAARLTLRGGTGHKYWSAFTSKATIQKSVKLGKELHDLLFEPESDEPLKTMDVPLGGSVSPIDALALLVDLLTIAANREPLAKPIDKYDDDLPGDATAEVLYRSLDVVSRITGSSDGSLGLHTAVYFYNDKGKHSKFLFLGMVSLISDKLRNNDAHFFKKFTKVRPQIEDFLIENKSLIGISLQNLNNRSRIPRVREMFDFLVSEAITGAPLEVEKVIAKFGLTGRIVDVRAIQTSPAITDETKSTIIIKTAIASAPRCPLCKGRLEPNKSKSYDHVVDKKYQGSGDVDNIQLTHPYCNNSKDTLLS